MSGRSFAAKSLAVAAPRFSLRRGAITPRCRERLRGRACGGAALLVSRAPGSSRENSCADRLGSQTWHFQHQSPPPAPPTRNHGARKSGPDLKIAECDERAVGVSDNGSTEEVGVLAGQIVALARTSTV